MGVVLNLKELNLSSYDIGKEGQDEKITGSTGGGTPPPPPSTECIESQSQKCAPYDFGPGGDYAGGATYQVEVGPGQVVSMPFTVVPGDWSGKISRYPTSSPGNVPDGAYGRFWLSATPGGEPLSIDSSEVGGTEAAWRWHLAGATDAEGFEIPNVAAVYYYNWTRCGPPDSDRTCSDPSTPPAIQTHDIYFRGTKSQGSGDTLSSNTTISTTNRDTSGSSGSAELKFKFNTLYPTIKITLDELVRDGGQEISTDKERSWIVINEYIKQKAANLTMEYSEFVGAINNQAVMRWGSGGNYQYVYHAVGVIIESICNGTEIIQTDTSGVNDRTNNNNNVGEPTCIDIDVTNIAGGAGLITSECLDECKHPKDYPALTNEYNKNLSNYTGSDSNYYESIVIKTEATLGYKGPDKDSSHGDKYALFQSQLNENISFEAGKVTSIPFTVPDYYQPDWINSAEASKLNSFYVDIDSANIIGDWEPGSEPGLLVWWSTYAGGPALGNPYLLAGIIDGTEVFATFSPFILNKYPDTNIVGYLGNKHGTRWINFTTFNRDLTTSTSINDLEIGSTAFMARMSSLGLTMKDKFSLSMKIPVPDCTKTSNVSASTITNSNNTMRSLPNMNSYIGPEWDGSLPSYVTIATNGGGIWGGTGDYLPDPGLNRSNGTRKLYTPLEGKIVAYAFTVNSSQKFNRNVNVFGQTPPGGNPLGSCSPALSSVVWWSATPGGEPLNDWRGQTSNVQRIGEALGDPRIDMVQAYDIQDVSKAEFNNVGLIPVISKTYYFNYAVVEQSIATDCKTNKRIPVPSELRPFDPKACDPTDIQPKPYTVTGFNFSPVDFDTWLQENTQ